MRPLSLTPQDDLKPPKAMYTQPVADIICKRLAEGESLRSICRDPGMPDHSTVLEWVRNSPEFANQYARARDVGDEAEFERLEELADEAPERTATGAVDTGWVAWQKNRVDTRKWTLARKRPKKYGDKGAIELTGPNGGPVQVTNIAIELVRPPETE